MYNPDSDIATYHHILRAMMEPDADRVGQSIPATIPALRAQAPWKIARSVDGFQKKTNSQNSLRTP